MIKNFQDYIKNRYKDWNADLGNFIHDKKNNLELIAAKVIDKNIEPATTFR